MRAFIAFEIPGHIRTAVSEVMAAFSRHGFLRIVPPQNMHVTIAFLGDINEFQSEQIISLLRNIPPAEKEGEAFFDAVSCFPSMERPRVIVLTGTNNDGKLGALNLKIRDGLDRMKIGFDLKPFIFHLTLARVSSQLAEIQRIIRQISERMSVLISTTPLVIADLRPWLFESILGKGTSPVYRRVE